MWSFTLFFLFFDFLLTLYLFALTFNFLFKLFILFWLIFSLIFQFCLDFMFDLGLLRLFFYLNRLLLFDLLRWDRFIGFFHLLNLLLFSFNGLDGFVAVFNFMFTLFDLMLWFCFHIRFVASIYFMIFFNYFFRLFDYFRNSLLFDLELLLLNWLFLHYFLWWSHLSIDIILAWNLFLIFLSYFDFNIL